jgi:hypothetical protein
MHQWLMLTQRVMLLQVPTSLLWGIRHILLLLRALAVVSKLCKLHAAKVHAAQPREHAFKLRAAQTTCSTVWHKCSSFGPCTEVRAYICLYLPAFV